MITAAERIQVEILLETQRMNAQFADIKRTLTQTRRYAQREASLMTKAYGRVTAGLQAMANAVVAYQAVMIARSMQQNIDELNLLDSRLKLVVKSTEELKEKKKALYDIAQEARVGYKDTVTLYTRMSRNARSLNIEESKLLTVTNAISKALIISGASAQSADAALVQLTQGFAANALRGQELNSVMEQIPRVSEAIATGMGVSIGRLRKLAEEGKLTTKVVVDALASQVTVLDKEFAAMTRTMEQTWVQVTNAYKLYLQEVDKAAGITPVINKILDGVRRTMALTRSESNKFGDSFSQALRSSIVYLDWFIDKLILAYETSAYGFGYLIHGFTMVKDSIAETLDYIITDISIKTGAWLDELKANWYSFLNAISAIEVQGIQITPEFVSGEAYAEAQIRAAESTQQLKDYAEAQETVAKVHSDTLKDILRTFDTAMATLQANAEAAMLNADASVQDRMNKLKVKILEYQKALGAISEPTFIKESGITDQERKTLEKQVKGTEALYNIEHKRLSLKHKLLELQSRELSGLEQAKMIAKHTVEREMISIANAEDLISRYKELRDSVSTVEEEKLRYNTQIAKAEASILASKIALEKAEQNWFKSLGESFNTIRKSTAEMRKQAKLKEQLTKAIKKDKTPIDVTKYKKQELKEVRDLIEAYKTLEDTEAVRYKILEAQTEEIRIQNDIVAAENEKWDEVESTFKRIANSMFDVYARTGDLGEAIGTAIRDAISSARSGDYGNTATLWSWGVSILQGLNAQTSAQIEAQLKEARGRSTFDDKSIKALGELYSKAMYPLLQLTKKNTLLLAAIVKDTDKLNRELKSYVPELFSPYKVLDATTLTGKGFKSTHDKGLLGSSTFDQSLAGAGLLIEQQNLEQAISEAIVKGFVVIKTESSDFFGLFKDTDVSTIYTDVSGTIEQYITDAYKNAYESILQSGVSLGFDEATIKEALSKVQIAQIKIDLEGLTGDAAAQRIREALGESFSAIIDQVSVFSDLIDTFAKGNESNFETLLRIAFEYEQASQLLKLTEVTIPEFAIKPGKETIYQEWIDKAEAATSDIWRSINEFVASTFTITKQEIVLQLTELAGGVENLNTLTAAYMNDFFTATERALKQKEYLQSVFDEAGIDLPKTKEEYKALVASMDLSTEEGRKMYLLLLQMAPAFASVADELGKLKDTARVYSIDFIRRIYTNINKLNADIEAALSTLGITDVDLGQIQNNFETSFSLEGVLKQMAESLNVSFNSAKFLSVLGEELGVIFDLDFDTVTGKASKELSFKDMMEQIAEQMGLETVGILDILKKVEAMVGQGNSELIKALGESLGLDKLELDGTESTTELKKKLKEYLDSVYEAVLGDSAQFKDLIDLYAQDSESNLDTLLRLAKEYSEAKTTLFFLGQTAVDPNDTLALIKETGGIDKFRSLTQEYLKTFYSENEVALKQISLLKERFASLGIALPKDVASYREMMEGIDLSTDSGRELYATLLQLSKSFYTAHSAADKLRQSADTIKATYDQAVRDAITGSFTIYTSAEQEAQLRQMAAAKQKEANDDEYLKNLKAATEAAFKMSPTREAFEQKFNKYIDALGAKKDHDINDIYNQLEDILGVLEDQKITSEKNSYQSTI